MRLSSNACLYMYAQCLVTTTAPDSLALLGNASCLTLLEGYLSLSTQICQTILCIARHGGAALVQSDSGFASLPLPGSTNFEDGEELSLELGMRPCESLEPGLPRPALPCPTLPCPALSCPAHL